ncbi:MAG: recombinase family protein [Bacteroidota bacterium]
MKLAVGYIRCSTDKQEDSPDQQRREIVTFAVRQGFTLVGWFEDFGKSGTTFEERAGFRDLRHAVENNPKFEAVICYDESRWGRAINSDENTFWRVHFRRCGIDVLLVKTSVDLKHEYAPMLQAFEGVQASQYSKKLSELTLRGAKNNSIYSNGGTAPYGYRRVAVNTKTDEKRDLADGEWSIRRQEKVIWELGVQVEIEVVKWIFEERIKSLGYVQIAAALNRRGVPCPKRGRWKNHDRKWSAVTIRTILENPVYYGARVYNRNSMSKIQAQANGKSHKRGIIYPHWMNDAKDWIITPNAHPAIVGRDTWEKASALRRYENNGIRNGHTYSSQFLLTGLVRCSKCGFSFQGWSGKAKGHLYAKYIDSGYKNKRVCSFLGIPKKQIEDFALSAVKTVLQNKEIINKVEQNILLLLREKPNQVLAEMESLKRALAKNEMAVQNLTRAIEEGVGLDSVLERMREVEKERLEIQKRIQSLKDEQETEIVVENVASQVRDFINNFEEVFEKAPIEERKTLIKKVISEIIVDRESNTIRFYIRKLPAVSPQLEDLLKKKRAPTEVVSARSSGGRT